MSFYVTGGTLRYDAACYVERQADKDLYQALTGRQFCYVLTSRQMGKSSLMVRTACRLRESGAQVVVLDLTAIGQNLTPEQWCDGLIVRMGRQLGLEEELEEFWSRSARIGPMQRFVAAIRDVALERSPKNIVIFADEIDAVRSLPFSTDEFFAAIRECYNRRPEDPAFNRVTFCLLGVATPSDLIRDTRTTPFNIGRRIELHDFAFSEAAGLAAGLTKGTEAGQDEALARLGRIFHWTNGHPYLTQRLCEAVQALDKPSSVVEVDNLCHELFLSSRARERDDNLLFVRERLLRSEVDRAGLLDLYLKIRKGKPVIDDETNLMVSSLRLSGVTQARNGLLQVRNKIYFEVFDRKWVISNMPDAELRRQREAFRRGLARGVVTAALLLASCAAILWLARNQLEVRQAHRIIRNLGSGYGAFHTYEDRFVRNTDIQYKGGMKMTISGSGSLTLKEPNKVKMHIRASPGPVEIEMNVLCDGERLVIYFPKAKEYLIGDAPRTFEGILTNSTVSDYLNACGTIRLYKLLLTAQPHHRLRQEIRNAEFAGMENLGGRPMYVIDWEEPSSTFGNRANSPKAPSESEPLLPFRAWVDKANGLIHQIHVDMSPAVRRVQNSTTPFVVQQLEVTDRHEQIRLNNAVADETFAFQAPRGTRRMEKIDVYKMAASFSVVSPPAKDTDPAFEKAALEKEIPKRSPQARPELIDLGNYYTAPLGQSFHTRTPGFDLKSLGTGIQTLAGVPFDIRGIVQLYSPSMTENFPEKIEGIKVGLACRQLHFLHATAYGAKANEGTQIGAYVAHYAGGAKRFIPIIYGQDVVDWFGGAEEIPTGIRTAWQGRNPASDAQKTFVRLFISTWSNPVPGGIIVSLDFISSMTAAAPFLVAVTAE